MLILPNDAIGKKTKKSKAKTSSGFLVLGYNFGIGVHFTGNYYLQGGIKVLPRLYVGVHLETFEQTSPFLTGFSHGFGQFFGDEPGEAPDNFSTNGLNFGVSTLYELGDWFFVGTLLPIGSSEFTDEQLGGNSPGTPFLWSLGVGYLLIEKINFGFTLSYFYRTYGDDPNGTLDAESVALGLAFKFGL